MSPLLKKRSEKKDNTLRNYCLVSGGIAFAIMIFTYACHSNTLLFGDNTVLRMDLYHQYGPLYSELYDRIVNGYSLVYSWTSGLGGSFLGNLFNYCCSPFALILLLFGHKNMPEAIAVMILLKAVASSMTFTYYINKSNKTTNKLSILFGLCYAFCSYFVAYSWNIMWLDAMSVFPLVILGIEYIIQYKKPSLFIFALTYTMITNYYMAYMVCILSVIYFLYYYFGRYELTSRLDGTKGAKKRKKNDIIPTGTCSADETENEGLCGSVQSESDFSLPFETVDTVSGDAENNAPGESVVQNSAANKNNGENQPAFEPAVSSENAEHTADTSDLKADNIADEVPSNINADPSLYAAESNNGSKTINVEPFADDNENIEGFSFSPDAITLEPERKSKKNKASHKEKTFGNSRFWVTGWTFALAALLCFLISAFALLPVYSCLQSSSATSASFPTDIKTYFNLFDFAANHLPALEPTIRSSGSDVLPNLYCGLLTLMLIPFYFLSDKISGRKKIASVVIIGVFFLGFVVNYFNFVWHGFHFPNDLPYRYSFAYSFILLTLAFKAIENITEFSRKAYIIVGMVFCGGAVLLSEIGSKNVDNYTIALTIVFAVLYVIVLGMMTSKTYAKRSVTALLIFTVAVELCFSNTIKYTMAQPKSNYTVDYDAYQQISELVDDSDDELFYRTELSKLRTRMDPCWFGYNGVSTFSSMAYQHVAALMESLGMFGNSINSYTYYPQTPVFNSMFSLKYIYDNEDLINNDDVYTSVGKNDYFEAYKNKYYLPLAFAVDEDVLKWDTSSGNPFTVQDNFIKSATEVNGILQSVDATDVSVTNLNSVSVESINSGNSFRVTKTDDSKEATATVTIKTEEAGDYYIYAGSTYLSEIKISADNFEYIYVSSSIQPFTINVGNQPAGAEIVVEYTLPETNDSASLTYCAAKCDLNKFDTAFSKIKSNGTINLTEFNESSFAGTIDVKNSNSLVYTSIPYDESWQITVDGQLLSYATEEDADTEGKAVMVGEALIGLDLESGTHTISFKYQPSGLKDGIVLSIIGAAALAVLLLCKFVFSKKRVAKGKSASLFYDPQNNIV